MLKWAVEHGQLPTLRDQERPTPVHTATRTYVRYFGSEACRAAARIRIQGPVSQ